MPEADAVFTLDPRLDGDTHALGHLSLCRVHLMNDARYPWLILVPARAGLVELIDLTQPEQALLMAEIAHACQALRTVFKPDKLNVAALGNAVPQLHVHVIARFHSDAAWPRPVWGVGDTIAYLPHQLAITMDRLGDALGLPQD